MIYVEVTSPYEAERIIKFLKKRGWTYITKREETDYIGSVEQLGRMLGLILFNDKTYGFLLPESLISPTTWTQKLQRQIKKGIIP